MLCEEGVEIVKDECQLRFRAYFGLSKNKAHVSDELLDGCFPLCIALRGFLQRSEQIAFAVFVEHDYAACEVGQNLKVLYTKIRTINM